MNYIFTPAADNILVKPLKRKWKTMKTPTPDVEKWKEEHDGQNPTMEDELETKMVKTKYLLEFQLAEVVDINPKLKPLINYKVGDVVVYDMKPAKEFNLIKGTELIRSFNIYGKWNELPCEKPGPWRETILQDLPDVTNAGKGDEKSQPKGLPITNKELVKLAEAYVGDSEPADATDATPKSQDLKKVMKFELPEEGEPYVEDTNKTWDDEDIIPVDEAVAKDA